MPKKKIAYLSHIDWNWIKQRPQFIAEGLSEHYAVDFYYFPSRRPSLSVCTPSSPKGLRLVPLRKLPFSGRSMIIQWIQKFINTTILRYRNYDLVWVCSPEILARATTDSLNIPIVYDCMDDMIECHSSPKYKALLLAAEQSLLRSATTVFASSNSLRDKMQLRGCQPDKITIVYNATKPASLFHNSTRNSKSDSSFFVITYFGTLSTWIDFALLYKLLEDNDLGDIHLKLIGPAEVSLKQHPRLRHFPPVPHEQLAALCADTDLFILPFILNDITRSVDPVKLYEYIALHRNIAAIYYKELDRYQEFVNFYSSYFELKKLIQQLMTSRKLTYDTLRADDFVDQNTWEQRVQVVTKKLNELLTS